MNYPALLDEFYGNFATSDEQSVKEIQERLTHYERLGMEKALQQTKNAAVAYVLGLKGFSLIMVENHDLHDNTKIINKINLDCTQTRITLRQFNWWSSVGLRDYNNTHGNPIPIECLRMIPAELIDKAVVFYMKSTVDPILAYPITSRIKEIEYKRIKWYSKISIEKFIESKTDIGRLYAGLWKWV